MIRIAPIRSTLAALVLGTALALPGLQLAQQVAPQAAHAAASSRADLLTFVGSWRNVNTSTAGITRIQIFFYGPTGIDLVDVYGKCHPTDCYWGRAAIISDGSPTVSATYHFSFATKYVYMWRDGSLLRVYSYTHFTDGSGRKDYSAHDIFQR